MVYQLAHLELVTIVFLFPLTFLFMYITQGNSDKECNTDEFGDTTLGDTDSDSSADESSDSDVIFFLHFIYLLCYELFILSFF